MKNRDPMQAEHRLTSTQRWARGAYYTAILRCLLTLPEDELHLAVDALHPTVVQVVRDLVASHDIVASVEDHSICRAVRAPMEAHLRDAYPEVDAACHRANAFKVVALLDARVLAEALLGARRTGQDEALRP